MRTYISLILNSEGANASTVVEVLRDIGFVASIGQHDFVYNWENEVTVENVLVFLDKVHKKLGGLTVQYQVSTIR